VTVGQRSPNNAASAIARPALAPMSGCSATVPGQGVLRLKSDWREGTTGLVISPLERMQRLGARVPRPGFQLIGFHGVPAPNARLRARVVPAGSRKGV